jgi:hypothetical protein
MAPLFAVLLAVICTRFGYDRLCMLAMGESQLRAAHRRGLPWHLRLALLLHFECLSVGRFRYDGALVVAWDALWRSWS